MDNDQFWIAIWRMVAVVVCVTICAITGCIMHANSLLAKSNDPIALRCGMNGAGSYGAEVAICLEKTKKGL
jgi:hypothetical protein